MSLPTSGFDTTVVRYTVATEGDIGFNFTVEVSAELSGVEDVVSTLDSALPTLAASLGGITGVSDVHVYKSYLGSIAATDIA